MAAPAIDLSADLAEGAPTDAELLACVTSGSIACGAHAGDASTARAACARAAELGVVVGAHPGHADREHHGRRTLPITPGALRALLDDQLDWLTAIAAPGQLHYLKAHGALYHQVAADPELAAITVDACLARELMLLGPPASVIAHQAADRGCPFAAEGFADRGYLATADGLTLAPRSDPRALLDPVQAARQAVRLAIRGEVQTIDGAVHPLTVQSLCVHGDGPQAHAVATAVRAALEQEGVQLRAFAA